MKETMRRQAGFTLLELLVAMALTLIVSGAIYGLMASGQNAFRKEPELTERQQNIRIAMDLLMRDVQAAGVGLPAFMQTFTQNLNAINCGAQCQTGPSAEFPDELEMLANTNERSNEPACHTPGTGNAANLRLVRGGVGLPPDTPAILIFADGTWTIRNIVDTTVNNTGAFSCDAGNNHTQLNVNQGGDTSGMNTPGGVCQPSANGFGNAGSGVPPNCEVTEVSFAEIIRWRIRHLDDANALCNAGLPNCVPSLQRFSSSLLAANPANPWVTVARGIEDLQVQYTQQNGAIAAGAPGAPAVVPGTLTSLTTRVQVTLWSRATGSTAAMAGLTTSAGAGPDALRGSLTSTTSPRMALLHIVNQDGVASPKPVPAWQ